MWAKQSTAATLIVGPILDSAGAEYASAVIGDLSISKNGGTLTAMASAATLTHIANGQYTLVTTTGNLDTLGRAQITCNKSTYQMPPVNLMVVPATVFDAIVTNAVNATGGLIGATATVSAVAGYIGASGAAINGTNVNTLAGHDPGATLGTSTLTQTQVTGGAYALNSASFGFNSALDLTTTQKTSVTTAATAATPIAASVTGNVGGSVASVVAGVDLSTTALGAIWNRLTSSMTTAGSIGKKLADWVVGTIDTYTGNTPQTGDVYARLGAPAGASVAADIAAVKSETATILSDTNELQTDWANGGRLDLILDARASQTSVDDIPTNAELATALATGVNVTQIDGSNLGTHGIGQFPADVRDWGGLGAVIAIDADNSAPSVAVSHIHDDVISAASVSAEAVTKIQNGIATASELLLVKDRVSYCLTVLVGACSDAGTSAETYVHAIGGETFTVDYTGLDATGNRTTTTLSKV